MSQWCHPTISSSAADFSSCPQSFPASGTFPVNQFITSGGQRIQHQPWFPLGLTGLISWLSKGLSRVFSSTTIWKHQFASLLYGPTLTSIHEYWKNHNVTIWTFVGKVMILLFNVLPRFFIAFLQRTKYLLISWLQSLSTVILKPPKKKSVTVSTVSPSICHEVMRPDTMILVFWMLSFKPTFSLYPFTFIKRLFSSSLSAISTMSSAYLRLLIFFLAILIPACASSSPAFHMIYSAYKLNKQNDNIQPWRTPQKFVVR